MTLGQIYLNELNAEATSTRKCLERIVDPQSTFKPHPKSMAMNYLALLVAEMPNWIAHIVTKGEIDLATFQHATPATTAELVRHFDQNLEAARKALSAASDADLDRTFTLKREGQVLFSSPIKDNVGSTINHLVHHRGQLTVYMRLNDLPVPSIYGPSADDKAF
jgi:uncharacterized damage-inducible protein DinB